MIERTIASSRPGLASVSWNIWRRSSLVRDLVRHFATARPGRLAGMSCDESISLRTVQIVGRGGLTKPREDCSMHVNCESPCTNIRDLIRIPLNGNHAEGGNRDVLGVRPSTLQPVFTLQLPPTENHTRTGAVPVDGGHLGVVPLRVQFRAPRVARDRVERTASSVDHDRIDDLRTATRKFELD